MARKRYADTYLPTEKVAHRVDGFGEHSLVWPHEVIALLEELARQYCQRTRLLRLERTSLSAKVVIERQLQAAQDDLFTAASLIVKELDRTAVPVPAEIIGCLDAIATSTARRHAQVSGGDTAVNVVWRSLKTDSTPLEASSLPWIGGRLRNARQALRPVPFLMRADAASEVMESEPLPADYFEDLELPFNDLMIWFDQPIELDNELLSSADPLVQIVNGFVAEARELKGSVTQLGASNATDFVRITGVQLVSAPNGKILPAAGIQVEASHGDPTADKVWGPINLHVEIRLDQPSVLVPLIVNLAGVVAFEKWKEPTSPPPDLVYAQPSDSTQFRKSARKISADSYLKLRTFDLEALVEKATVPLGNDVAADKQVKPHDRRGHWHRYRIGPRASWDGEYLVRWVPKMRINATLDPTGQPDAERVYRLPVTMGDGFQPYFRTPIVRVTQADQHMDDGPAMNDQLGIQ